MSLRWLSFADGKRPTGQQFLGAIVIDAPSFAHAIKACWALGINPGGEVVQMPADPTKLAEKFPAELREKLLSRADLERLFDDLMTLDELERRQLS